MKKISTAPKIRLLKILLAFARICSVFIFSAFIAGKSTAQKPPPGTVADFMGTNSNVAAYDYHLLDDLSKCFKWVREYHNWEHYENSNNYYKWDNVTTGPQGYTWPDHNKFMDECMALGINILIDTENKPSWPGGIDHIPNHTGDGSKVSDYLERLEFIGQLVARYGSKTIDDSLLETTDKASGLDYITYFEDENEPDFWWWSPQWPAENYAKYCNAVHDGTGVETSPEYPLLGIKSVDPNAKHVLAGLASTDSIYIDKILKASNGRVPFDVINMHMYCTDHTDAYPPEHETYGFEKGFANIFKWKKRNLPDMPIWITEFGWDTYLANSGAHSYTYATFGEQANYLMRSYFIFMKMGFEKAFMFMAGDGNSYNTLQYSSSGVLKDKNLNFEKKPSFYYLATMQHVLGLSFYKRTTVYAEKNGENEVYCFEFETPENQDKIYALWTRKTGSINDVGAKTTYSLDLGKVPETSFVILPKDKDEDGDTISVEYIGTKANLNLTETPLFLVASDIQTRIKEVDKRKPLLKVYPNPAKGKVNISIQIPSKSEIQLSLFSSGGRLIKYFPNRNGSAGEIKIQFGDELKPGIYYVKCQSKWGVEVKRVIIL